jgi:hypothetical protein
MILPHRPIASVCLALTLAVLAPILAHAATPAVYLPDPPSSAAQALAVAELRRALYAMSGEVAPAVKKLGDRPTIIMTVASDPAVRDLVGKDAALRKAVSALGAGDFLIRQHRVNLVVVATTDDGLMAGCAALERAYGCGAYFGGDSFPHRAGLPWPIADRRGHSKFDARGTLPWYNFWDSPTTWNDGDWRAFLDSMSRQGMNLIAVHNYDYEALCAYPEGKEWRYGFPLFTSKIDNWGCRPMKTEEFGYGSGAIYYQDYFGPDLSTAGLAPAETIAREQKLFADAMAYAHARGIRTCLGFEVGADPTDPDELKRFEARIHHVLQRYPLDYLWIWEPEGMGINGCMIPDPYSRFGTYVRRWHDIFAYLADEKRIAEAVRITLYAQAACQMVRSMNPKVRIALGGWGGDQWLRFTDFFPGMDKLLPKDVVFSALDNIAVTPKISENYARVKGREMWPIPWFEYDGDQWAQHSNTRQWAGACADAETKGCSGILGIHWRQREVEESAAYMARYAWGEAGTLDDFYKQVAADWFGESLARDGAAVLLDLQGLGYRWTGGGGATECGGLAWGPGRDDAKLEKLRGCRERLAQLEARARAGEGAPVAAERLRWFTTMADWTIAYELTARALADGGDVAKAVAEAQAASEQKAGDAAAKASKALNILGVLPMGEGLAKLTGIMSDRGDLGMLASINCKAWWQVREFMRKMADLAGKKLDPEPDLVKTLGTRLVVPERPTTVAAGQDIRLRVAVLGGAAAKIQWRAWGGKWRSAPLRPLARAVQEAVIPGATVLQPGIEWFLEAAGSDGSTDRFPPRGFWVTAVAAPWAEAPMQTIAARTDLPAPVKNLTARQLGYGGIELAWDASPDGGVLYTVARRHGEEAVALGVAADPWFEDTRPVAGDSTYTVTASFVGGKPGPAASVVVKHTPVVPSVPAGWKAEAGPRRILLTLPPVGMDTRAVRAYLRAPGETEWRPVMDLARPKAGVPVAAAILAPPGHPAEVTLASIGLGGGESDKAPAQTVTPEDKDPVPAVLIAGATPDIMPNAQLVGAAKWGEDAGRRTLEVDGGGVQMPLPDALKAPAGLTVAFWLKPRVINGMPVVIDNGTWRQDGFFLQTFGGAFRWHVAPEDFDGGLPVVGQWQHVAGIWDGNEGRLYVNGVLVTRRAAALTFIPSPSPLFLGRYILDQDIYFTRGSLADVRIYPLALTESEVKALAKSQ